MDVLLFEHTKVQKSFCIPDVCVDHQVFQCYHQH
jgi:hypothetical protein